MSNIHVYTIAYNEEIVLPFMINHYRKQFPDCKITVYDNQSTDSTRQIALDGGCEVLEYNSNNEIRDDLYLNIKNNCWKKQSEKWALVCDVDELLHITEDELLMEQNQGVTIIKTEGWNMITTNPNPSVIDLEGIKYGSRAPQYDKSYLFDTKSLTGINYGAGCHYCSPVGNIKHSTRAYKILHYKAISEDYVVMRHLEFGRRMSQQNLKHGWGTHYLDSEETMRRNHKYFQTHPELVQVL